MLGLIADIDAFVYDHDGHLLATTCARASMCLHVSCVQIGGW